MVRQERLDDAKRTRLIGAAIEEFTERGFEAASYNKIIERSGLSKGTVYYYFDNKEALLRTVLEDACDRFVAAIGRLTLPETREQYWGVLLEYHKRVIEFFFENPALTRVMFWVADQSLNLDVFKIEAHERALSCMEDILVRGQEIGAVRSDLPVNTIQKLMHSVGDVLCTAIMGKNPGEAQGTKETMQADIKKFAAIMHDLSIRILTPGEVRDVE